MENLPTYRLTQSGPETQEILDQVNLNTVDIEQLKRLYQALTQSDPEIIEPTDTWPVANPEENVIYRVIDRVNTPPQYYSDYMWNGTSMVLMGQYNNAIDNEPTANSNNLVKSGGVYSFVHANGGAYDISAAHAVGGVLATYDDLADALGTNGANVPAAVRKGGMSIKFVLSSDNKYVQYRYMLTDVSTAATFTNVANWQGVDDEPTAGSDNLVKSGGVKKALNELGFYVDDTEWVEVVIDREGKILKGIKANGSVEWSVGVPTPVKEYIEERIGDLSSKVDVSVYNQKMSEVDAELGSLDAKTSQIENGTVTESGDAVSFLDDNNVKVCEITPIGVKAIAYLDMNGNALENPLFGKKAVFFGDSITQGIATNDASKQSMGGWVTLFHENDGMITTNNGVGGLRLADYMRNGSLDGICKRVKAANLDQYDYVIFSGGFNDFPEWPTSGGTITANWDSAFDTSKTLGALEDCCNYLESNFPDKHVGFILPYNIGSSYNTYCDQIVEVLEKWSMPYIDLRKVAGFNLNNNSQAYLYGVYEGNVAWYSSANSYSAGDKCQWNGVVYQAKTSIQAGHDFNENEWNLAPEGTSTNTPWHCNVIGYRKMFKQIESWVKTL